MVQGGAAHDFEQNRVCSCFEERSPVRHRPATRSWCGHGQVGGRPACLLSCSAVEAAAEPVERADHLGGRLEGMEDGTRGLRPSRVDGTASGSNSTSFVADLEGRGGVDDQIRPNVAAVAYCPRPRRRHPHERPSNDSRQGLGGLLRLDVLTGIAEKQGRDGLLGP